ncbi:MAG: hypothetical protein U1G08_16755 [Verrucomicrobiota bacterium]
MNPASDLSYTTRLEEILWGAVLIGMTLMIHAYGMILAMRFSRGFKERFERPPAFYKGMINLVLTTWIISGVHIGEVMAWAGFFQWQHCFENYSTANYFTFLEYTTVGSQLNLPLRWRLLEGMVATAGLLGFAWSTGVLLTVAQEFQEEQLRAVQQRRGRRGNQVEPGGMVPSRGQGGNGGT